jgi:hypothetical protein
MPEQQIDPQIAAQMQMQPEYQRDPAPDTPAAKLIEFVHTLKPFKHKQMKDANTGEFRNVVTGGDVDSTALTDFWGHTSHMNSLSYMDRRDMEFKRINFKISSKSYVMAHPRSEFTPMTNAKLDQIENLVEAINEMSVDGFGHVMGVTQRVEQSSKNEFKQVAVPSKGSNLANNVRGRY